jgi:hypothetical protein
VQADLGELERVAVLREAEPLVERLGEDARVAPSNDGLVHRAVEHCTEFRNIDETHRQATSR